MHKIDLHERFVESLKGKFNKRSELVNYISETLRIEREPASRRLSGRVSFSVTEIGILAEKLGISLDSLLFKTDSRHIIPFHMEYPKGRTSFDNIIEVLESSVLQLQELSKEPADIGTIFDSLPVEFFVPYPDLCKFLYFKWGHFFVGSSEFKDYAKWQIPPKLDSLHKQIIELYDCYRSVIYIWDNPAIWNLANDIRYLMQIDILKADDAQKVKADIHQMLNDLEDIASGGSWNGLTLENSEFYVSSINIGMTLSYIMGDSKSISFFKTYFVHSYASEDRNFCIHARSWINSMKKVSTLISGSGEKERTLFFKEQHKIVDMIG